MTKVELKNILIHQIIGIEDRSFLTAIKKIVETKSASTVYKTNQEQVRRIKEGREQIARGEFYSNDQVEMEIDTWLEEK
jgi:predicted transcriptional regulator